MNAFPFEVVDSQVHLNWLGLGESLVAMSAVGIDALVIDEFVGFDEQRRPLPGHLVENGAMRTDLPFSEDAVKRYPDLFTYITRVDPDDPELELLISSIRTRPGCVALRLIPWLPVHPFDLFTDPRYLGQVQEAARSFAADVRGPRYRRYFALAEQYGVPVFLQINGYCAPGDFSLATELAQRHPGLRLIVDHTGMELPVTWDVTRPDRFRQVPELLALAKLPNVYIKWAHSPLLSEEPYPFLDVREVLHQVVDALGVDRVMWASDWTVDMRRFSWLECLSPILDDDGINEREKAALLGGTVRTVLDWPSPKTILPTDQ